MNYYTFTPSTELLSSDLNDPNFLIDQHINQRKTVTKIAREQGVDIEVLMYFLRKFNIEHQKFSSSQAQTEMYNYVKTVCKDYPEKFVIRTSSPTGNKQLLIAENRQDITKSLIFATMFPCESYKKRRPNDYYFERLTTRFCEMLEVVNTDMAKNIFSPYDFEWFEKNDIVKSYIRSALGISLRNVDAKDTTPKLIERSIAKKFLEENHIEGYANFHVAVGLYQNDELLYVMCLNRMIMTYDDCDMSYTVVRECHKKHVWIQGGIDKTIKYFKKCFKSGFDYIIPLRFGLITQINDEDTLLRLANMSSTDLILCCDKTNHYERFLVPDHRRPYGTVDNWFMYERPAGEARFYVKQKPFDTWENNIEDPLYLLYDYGNEYPELIDLVCWETIGPYEWEWFLKYYIQGFHNMFTIKVILAQCDWNSMSSAVIGRCLFKWAEFIADIIDWTKIDIDDIQIRRALDKHPFLMSYVIATI